MEDPQSGITAEPMEDDIYHWSVNLSNFSANSNIGKDLHQLKTKFGYDYIQLQMDFSMNLYPFYPPLVKVIKPSLQGNNHEKLVNISLCKLFQLSYWNPVRTMKSVLMNVKGYLESYVRIDFDDWRNNLQVLPLVLLLEDLLSRLAVVSEISPRLFLQQFSEKEKTLSFLEFNTKDSLRSLKKKQFWNKGIGYSTLWNCQKDWSPNRYVAAQKEKDIQVQKVLWDIVKELQHFNSLFSQGVVESCPNQIVKTSVVDNDGQQNGLNESKTDESWDSLTSGTSSIWPSDQASSYCSTFGSGADPELANKQLEDSRELYMILENSSLIPFLEQYLEQESYVEISRHTGIYKAIIQLLKEIAQQPTLVPLFGPLPNQKQSIHQLLGKLAQQASYILRHVGKVAANGCIPGMPVSSEEESSEESICGSGSAERRKTVGGNSEEKLAKDFSNLYDLISEELLKHGQVANGVVPELKNGSTESLISECSLSCETDSLASTYKKCLKSLQFESWPMETEGSNSHHFANHYRKCGAGPPNQILRIAQELTSLHSSLPLELSSSIFVRTDDEKSCFLRALITGPEGTPYSNGCFLFDVYFPYEFPNNPPMVNFQTTGGGTVRFNPNLYKDGWVCLSLLNTWRGFTEEHWHSTSTVLQVLISIQSFIFTEKPYFNEPGYESKIGTERGNEQSYLYNRHIRCANIKYAMLGQLRNPSPGFGEVIKSHFYIKRHQIIQEVESWATECSEVVPLAQVLKKELTELEPPNEDVARLASSP
ncbi:dual E2 ubiquitin-conjugating enzyme/E3 ubiquitin-protein ligase BIRC6-like isoform X1 [Tachypleus tridentatus]|uniref:dual E2 ubiquitin-conjugating enzyme/E3 ubiquitin-protein ligase BIRC6-like isoform X1 n=2 Tax=Tachypleus tridentatus TaxID=6853 RepID=UPI003FD2B708